MHTLSVVASERVREEFFYTLPEDVKKTTGKKHLKLVRTLLTHVRRPCTLEEETICTMMHACIDNRIDELCHERKNASCFL